MRIRFPSIIILRAHQRTQFLPTTIYHVSSNKRQVWNKRRPHYTFGYPHWNKRRLLLSSSQLISAAPLHARLLKIAPYTNGSLTKITYETSIEPAEPCPNCWYLNSFIVFGWLTVRFLCVLYVFMSLTLAKFWN